MTLFAVCFTDETIEFFWADDFDHAIEQAQDSRRGQKEEVYAVAFVPYVEKR